MLFIIFKVEFLKTKEILYHFKIKIKKGHSLFMKAVKKGTVILSMVI